MHCRHAVQFFVDRTYEHLPPEAFNSPCRLLLLAQPLEHCDLLEVLPPAILRPNGQQPTRHAYLVRQRNEFQACKRLSEVEWRRQQAALHHRYTPTWLNPIE